VENVLQTDGYDVNNNNVNEINMASSASAASAASAAAAVVAAADQKMAEILRENQRLKNQLQQPSRDTLAAMEAETKKKGK
jgi:enterochelin esterase-like enzyme